MSVYTAIRAVVPYGLSSMMLASVFRSDDAFAQPSGAVQGMAFGNTILGSAKAPANLPTIDASQTNMNIPTVTNGNITTNQVSPNRGEVSGEVTVMQSSFGSETAYTSMVNGTSTRLATENSPQGEGFRTMFDSRKPRSNVQNASFLDRSKNVLTTPFTGCSQTETILPTPKEYDLKTYEYCSRVIDTLQDCKVTRLYQIHQPPVAGDAYYVNDSEYRTAFSNAYVNLKKGSGVYFNNKSVTIDWSNTAQVIVMDVYGDDQARLEYQWLDGPSPGTWNYLAGTFSGYSCGDSGGAVYGPSNYDVTSILSGKSNLLIRLVGCVKGTGWSTANMKWVAAKPLYEDLGFLQQPLGCWDKQFNNSFCHADSWTCNDSSTKIAGGTPITIARVKNGGGKEIWQDNTPYVNTAFEGTNVCWDATATGLCNFNVGSMGCFTDVHGNTVCPNNDGTVDQTSCQDLEAKGCFFVSEECTEGALDTNTGECMVYTSKYQCGQETVQMTGTVETSVSVNCNATRCMGAECMSPSNESNHSFGQVTALMGNVNALGQDADCDASGCKLFKGEVLRCKIALGGAFNCCNETIDGVSWVDYMKLAYQSYKGAQDFKMVADLTASVKGTISELASSASSSITDLIGKEFMTSWDGITSGMSSAASQTIATMQSAVIEQLHSFTLNTFGETAANALFTQGSTGWGLSSSLTAAVGTIMSVIMWVYIIYLILTIVFACEEDEFKLAAQKQMKACHYVGSYCSGGGTGSCYQKSQTWCCYSSALSRIMQEQVRLQILGWGTAKNPNCGGLTTGDLALVDWSKVDMSEYVAMMTIANVRPQSGQEEQWYDVQNITKINLTQGGVADTNRGPGSPGIDTNQQLGNLSGGSSGYSNLIDQKRMEATSGAKSAW